MPNSLSAPVDRCAGWATPVAAPRTLSVSDPSLAQAMADEMIRQEDTIELIASENYVSRAVLEAQGSVLTNKYAEGYPGKRYYGGCRCVDVVEQLAIERAKQLFGAEHANVQPHSGSQANAAAYMAVLNLGDTVLSMSTPHGGHLTHGHRLSFSGRQYHFVHYGVSRETERIDYDALEQQALAEKPRMLVVGASAYPRFFDFARLRQIADAVEAYLLVDMAHVAGLVATGVHPSPVPYADIVTSTTHKTLRGPRGGLILCKQALAKQVDTAVFPGIQGGPLMHVIAAKAAAFAEALEPSFVDYARRIVTNAAVLADELQQQGFRLVSGGTDNHMILVDLSTWNVTGRDAERALDDAGLACNKNMIPFDNRPPATSSGIRLGTPAATTRGLGPYEMRCIGRWIARVLRQPTDAAVIKQVRAETLALCRQFPLYT